MVQETNINGNKGYCSYNIKEIMKYLLLGFKFTPEKVVQKCINK